MIWRHTLSLWILYFAWNLSKYFKSQIAHQVYNLENNIMVGLKLHFSLFWRQLHYEIIIFHANFSIPLRWAILSDLSVKSFLIIFFSVSNSSHHTTSSSSTFLQVMKSIDESNCRINPTHCVSYLKNCSDTQSFSHVLLCSFMLGPQSHSPVVDKY